jgi:hypothetical protein
MSSIFYIPSGSSDDLSLVAIKQKNIAQDLTLFNLRSDLTDVESGISEIEANLEGIADLIDTSVDGTLSVGPASTIETINIGTGSGIETINLGAAGAQLNILGTLATINTTNLDVVDKLIRLNKDGPTSTGFGAGIEIEENGSATGYIKTNGDRSAWLAKAPSGAEFTLGQATGITTATADTVVQRDSIGGGNFTSVVATNGVNSATLVPSELFTDNYQIGMRTRTDQIESTDVEWRMNSSVRGAELVTQQGNADIHLVSRNQSTNAFQGFKIRMETRFAEKWNASNPTELHLIDQSGNFVARLGNFNSIINGSLSLTETVFANGLNIAGNAVFSVGSLISNSIDMTPAEATITNTFNPSFVRDTFSITIRFRRYGDLVFWTIPPINTPADPTNAAFNADAGMTAYDYFLFSGEIPGGFRPTTASNRSLTPVCVWNGSNPFTIAFVHMISNGAITVQLPSGQSWTAGQTAGWHTQLTGSYRII